MGLPMGLQDSQLKGSPIQNAYLADEYGILKAKNSVSPWDINLYGDFYDAFKMHDDYFLPWLNADGNTYLRRIPWRFPQDGCYLRGRLLSERIAYNLKGSPSLSQRIYAFGDLGVYTPNHPEGEVHWRYHTALIAKVDDVALVADPALEPNGPLKMETWLKKIVEATNTPVHKLKIIICDGNSYTPTSGPCNGSGEIPFASVNPDEIAKKTRGFLGNSNKDGSYPGGEWENVRKLGLDPNKELLDEKSINLNPIHDGDFLIKAVNGTQENLTGGFGAWKTSPAGITLLSKETSQLGCDDFGSYECSLVWPNYDTYFKPYQSVELHQYNGMDEGKSGGFQQDIKNIQGKDTLRIAFMAGNAPHKWCGENKYYNGKTYAGNQQFKIQLLSNDQVIREKNFVLGSTMNFEGTMKINWHTKYAEFTDLRKVKSPIALRFISSSGKDSCGAVISGVRAFFVDDTPPPFYSLEISQSEAKNFNKNITILF